MRGAQQDRLAGQVAARTGFALNSEGKLTAFNPGADVLTALTTGRSSSESNIGYRVWRQKGSGYTVAELSGTISELLSSRAPASSGGGGLAEACARRSRSLAV